MKCPLRIVFQVFQRRMNGVWPFIQYWIEFETGFGDLEGDFWLGNMYIQLLTRKADQKVKFHLRTADGEEAYANYNKFWIDSSKYRYRAYFRDFEGATQGKLY